MVFSSIPLYLDPSNWHQQQPNQLQTNGTNRPHELHPPLSSQSGSDGNGGGSGRLGPVADQATQLAKMMPPDQTPQKCPRCESTNTKFCYYNNYNLSQPRHFCKTCRRYWTRGGALRNVPVGGGCRRNKKNKRSSSSKSPSSTDNYKPTLSNSTSSNANPSGIVTPDLTGRFPQLHNPTFMASLQNMNRYGMGNIGSSNHMGLQIGGHGLTSVGGVLNLQQFPFFNGFEPTSAVSYPFQSESVEVAPYGLVKLEGLNSSRNPMSVSENNHEYYSWTDLSRLASSSTSHLH